MKENRYVEVSHGGSGFIGGLIIGIAVGGLLGLLLAPRPGRETAAMLLEKTQGLGKRLSELVTEASASVKAATQGGNGSTDAR